MTAPTAIIIDGAAVAARVRGEVAEAVAALRDQYGRPPGLATILVGDDPASRVYVSGKRRACEEVGIASFHHELPDHTGKDALLMLIDELRERDDVDGILVQLPLPVDIDVQRVIDAIPPSRDIDGFHPINVGSQWIGREALPQCTPAGIMRLLGEYDVDIEGADAVIVGRSNIVGKPLAQMLLKRNATVTIAHTRTRDLASHTRRADILVAAVGHIGTITGDMVKPGATVIDVGMNRNDAGKLCGDVNFDEVASVAGRITPVPGGVGPMTIAMLLVNTVAAMGNRLGGR